MTTTSWLVLIVLVGQLPVYLAYDRLRRLVEDATSALCRGLRMAAASFKKTARAFSIRNRTVLLLDHELRIKHNLERKYSQFMDVHLKELELIPAYMKKIDEIEKKAREQKLSLRDIVKLTSLTKRLERATEKVIQKGHEMDKWARRQKLAAENAEKLLGASLFRAAVTSTLTIVIAIAAVFVNFNLIALPMGELVPEDQLVAGFSVASISAGVIVLLELVVGIFLLESMGITKMFGFGSMASWHVRIIGLVSFLGLLFLASTEATLAIMREQIVAADAALKTDLAGAKNVASERSLLPMYGQAVLGFVLPWIIAMVGIPLELALETYRQAVGRVIVFILKTIGVGFRLMVFPVRFVSAVILGLMEVYTAVPRYLGRPR